MAENARKLVTGNRLGDGVPVYFAGAGTWSPTVGDALLVDAGAAEDLLAEAQKGGKPLPAVGVELIEAVREGPRIVPVTLREKIRAFGPTVPHG
ncbi:MAG: DUF2849 domain-containing protein [Stellaceae bacterium]